MGDQCWFFGIARAAYELCKEQDIAIDYCNLHEELHSCLENQVDAKPIVVTLHFFDHIEAISVEEKKINPEWIHVLKDYFMHGNVIEPIYGKKETSDNKITHVIFKTLRDKIRYFVILSKNDTKDI